LVGFSSSTAAAAAATAAPLLESSNHHHPHRYYCIDTFSVQQEGKNKQKQAPQTQWLFSSSSYSSFLSLTFVSLFYIYYYSWHTTQY
jgi:hypothetical protein